MTKAHSNVIAKVAAVVAGFGLVAMSFAPAAKAATAAELEAQIQALLAQIAQLQGSASASVTFTRDLTLGSTGADVTALQNWLISKGFTIAAGATGYFGAQTQAAVAKYQASVGISPAAGYFGPITRAKVNASAGGSTGGNDDDDDDDSSSDDELSGGAGSVDTYTLVGSLNNEEVGEGEDDAEVAGLEIEVDDSSDIRLTAVRLVFNEGTAASDFEDYAEEVSLWLDGEEIARVDADEFTDDNDWTKTISVDSSAIIRAGDTGELVVAVTGAGNIDSADLDDTWTVDFTQVRFEDADGATISEDPTTGTRTFSFVAFATASDLELKVRESDEDVNDARAIAISDTDGTDNVEVLAFEIEVEGDSDVTIDDLTVDFTSVGAGVGEIINNSRLVVDGDVIGTASTSIASTTATTMTVTYDDLDWELKAGETVEVIVEVDVNDLDGAFTAGDTLTADVNPDDAGWDVEDEEGDNVVAADKTGAATSEAHSFHADALDIEDGAADTTSTKDTNGDTAGGERGIYTLKFDVTAFGDAIYIPLGATTGTSSVDTDDGLAYAIENSDGNQVALNDAGLASTTAAVSSTASMSGDYYVVNEGSTESFTLTVELTPLADGFFRAQLYGVNFNVGSAAAADTLQQATPTTDFETDYVSLDA